MSNSDDRYKFSVDWFSPNTHVWSHYLEPLKNNSDLQFLEVGSFQGRSTVWMLENILTGNGSQITCVDTFEGSIEHNVIEEWAKMLPSLFDVFLYNTSFFPGRVQVKRGKSGIVLKELALSDKKYDFIYVDGDHMASSVLEDGVLCFPLLKLHGLLCFDDYGSSNKTENLNLPYIGIETFMKIYAQKIRVLFVGYQVWIEKISE
jgi:hypothetical protein